MVEMALEVVGLSKRFGARMALEGLAFTVRPGSVVGLLGPNGAGKTTTIRLLTTVLTPTAGDFWVAGIPGGRPIDIRRRIGVLPENPGYPGHQSGREYLHYHARLSGLPRAAAETRTADLLEEVGIPDRAGSPISTYSRGMRQRLGIARTLVNDPTVVFLDEPALGLDPAGQHQMLAIVRDIARRRGATVVLSTHSLPEVEQVCSDLLILNQGRMVAAGPVAEVIRAAGTSPSARLRVPVELVSRAAAAIARVPGVMVQPSDGEADVLRVTGVTARHGQDVPAAPPMNLALSAVLAADVPVLSFEVEGTRLSDAFAIMTTAPDR
jgi:ABC-2 type transport system ATP-binding protein